MNAFSTHLQLQILFLIASDALVMEMSNSSADRDLKCEVSQKLVISDELLMNSPIALIFAVDHYVPQLKYEITIEIYRSLICSLPTDVYLQTFVVHVSPVPQIHRLRQTDSSVLRRAIESSPVIYDLAISKAHSHCSLLQSIVQRIENQWAAEEFFKMKLIKQLILINDESFLNCDSFAQEIQTYRWFLSEILISDESVNATIENENLKVDARKGKRITQGVRMRLPDWNTITTNFLQLHLNAGSFRDFLGSIFMQSVASEAVADESTSGKRGRSQWMKFGQKEFKRVNTKKDTEVHAKWFWIINITKYFFIAVGVLVVFCALCTFSTIALALNNILRDIYEGERNLLERREWGRRIGENNRLDEEAIQLNPLNGDDANDEIHTAAEYRSDNDCSVSFESELEQEQHMRRADLPAELRLYDKSNVIVNRNGATVELNLINPDSVTARSDSVITACSEYLPVASSQSETSALSSAPFRSTSRLSYTDA